ncbi:MAG: S-adenosyl-l-methionine hydroxide adenosyltransferase family protein [Candidatus Dormibacteria bacterium]
MRRPIVFVTDYGRDDAYAAALTGAAWRVEPRAVCVDGTHGVPPGDVLAGAYHLKSLAVAFGRDIVLCGVVDPGVGTSRRAIATYTDGVFCVAPDNGLVSYLWSETAADARAVVELDLPDYASNTFHGRDVFAPTAAQLASGANLDDIGEAIDDPIVLDEAFATRDLGAISGRVAVVDHFGNAITTVRARDLRGASVASVTWDGGSTPTIVSTYAEIQDGVAALFGSVDHLEIAARGAPAASLGGPQRGGAVTVQLV